MLIEYRDNSLKVNGTNVWLDTSRRKGLAEADTFYISHAHAAHADFVELVAYVLVARPRKVYTLHGPPEFAKHLKAKGIDAEHLPTVRQLKLWSDL